MLSVHSTDLNSELVASIALTKAMGSSLLPPIFTSKLPNKNLYGDCLEVFAKQGSVDTAVAGHIRTVGTGGNI